MANWLDEKIEIKLSEILELIYCDDEPMKITYRELFDVIFSELNRKKEQFGDNEEKTFLMLMEIYKFKTKNFPYNFNYDQELPN